MPGGLAAAGELLGDVPAGLGDRVDENDAAAGGEVALDGGDVGLEDVAGACRRVAPGRAERGEKVAGRTLDAALAVVEGAVGEPGRPARGEDDDGEIGLVEVALDVAGRIRRSGGCRPGRCGSGPGPAGRRCG